MIINIGKYEINDWVDCDHLTSLRVCYDSSSSFGIYIYYDNNKWHIAIYDDFIMDSYKLMFNNCLEFDSMEDGKMKVDLFLDKLQKLKTFL